MPKSNFPSGFMNGVTIRGVPIQQSHPGEVFWVNNSSVVAKNGIGGSNSSNGSYRTPFSTVTYALTKCVASRGDVIMIMPGYTEDIDAAAAGVWNVAGVAIVGLGTGSLRPTFTFSATASDIDVTAANAAVTNCMFVASVANVVHGLQVTGANFTIDNCYFGSTTAAASLLTSVITTAAAIGFAIVDSTINQEVTTAGTAVTDVAASGVQTLADLSVITGNTIMGEFSVSCVYNVTTAALGMQINDNNLYNSSTAAAAGAVSLAAGCTGTCFRNHALALEVSAITGLFINASLGMSENYAVNVVTETAGLVHAAST